MKTLVIGHTSGIGEELTQILEADGVSRSTGFDINNRNNDFNYTPYNTIILNAYGDDGILTEAFDLKMVPGAYMDEENIGTNAMSIVIQTQKPVQMSGKDHFIKNIINKFIC